MAIKTLPQITVNGRNTLFGGYIYNIKYKIAYGDSKSNVKISVVSESGDYNISSSDLSNTYCGTYSIKIGTKISFTGFLEGYSYSANASGKVLELEFVDNSRILDITYVGLYKKHGLKSTKHLILVGKEVDACNPDGYATPIEKFYDPCNPCIVDEKIKATEEFLDCVEKAKYEINDVKYNFTELLAKIKTAGINITGAVDSNPKYLARHTGTLREVLLKWCSDFGFFFYWDQGKAVFKDLRNTIQVKASIQDFCPDVVDYTENYSMSNSLKTATITNFSRPGDPAKVYTCQEARYIQCESLTQNAALSTSLTVSSKIDSIAAGFAYYSETLRDLYYFYSKYQMNGAAKFTPGKVLEKLGMKILSNAFTLGDLKPIGQNISSQPVPKEFIDLKTNKNIISLDPFTLPDALAVKIGNLFKPNLALINANRVFKTCVQTLSTEMQWKIVQYPNSYFFFLAEKDEAIENEFLNEERKFADFLNKYAVFVPNADDTFFTSGEFALDLNGTCGYNDFVDTGNVTYQALGDITGGFKFYNTSSVKNNSTLGDLPFAGFLAAIRDTRSSVSSEKSRIAFKLIVVDRGKNSFIPSPGADKDDKKESILNKDLISAARGYLPYQIKNKNNLQGTLITDIANIDVANSTAGNIYLYLGHAVGKDDFLLTEINGFNNYASQGTLFDGVPINKAANPQDQRVEVIFQYPELKCKIIGNNTPVANRVVFKTPVGSFKYTEPTSAAFGVVVQKTHIRRRIISKVESFNKSNLDDGESCNYAQLAVNYQNISDDSLKILTKANQICEYNTKQIQTIHEEFVQNLTVDLTEPSISKSFKIAGVDVEGYTPTIENGLLNIDISVDDKGVFSTYEFGTRLMILPNIETFTFGREFNSDRPGSYTNTVNYFPTVKK
ncbi:hypothetical protein [Flavobacterium sp.]|uniref:hypothetical protein n=1 Tax=Flavobacterium sp. TaxID=239 RepID=UPI0038FC88CB